MLKKGRNKNIYNIGTQDEIKILQLIQKLVKISNKKLIIKKTKEKLGSTPKRCPDIKKISKLGFKPKINLDVGLKKTFEWYSN